MTDLKTNSDFSTPPAMPTGSFTAEPEANRDALDLLFARITQGEEALAKRKDLTELHKRIVTMFTTLNQGLVEGQLAKAQEDRAQLVQRLDQVERAVNSMEGALRIELEPLILNIVTTAVAKIGKDDRKYTGSPLVIAIGFLVALAFGVYFSTPITAFLRDILSLQGFDVSENYIPSSPIGGSASDQNHFE